MNFTVCTGSYEVILDREFLHSVVQCTAAYLEFSCRFRSVAAGFFQGIYDPGGVQQEIVHAQEAFLQRVTEHDRRQRRDEMVELLDIYHERYQGRSPRSDKA